MQIRRALSAALLATATATTSTSWAQQATTTTRDALSASSIQQIPAAGVIEVGFSPNKGAEDLVLKTIRAAKSEIKVMAHAFSSAKVASALLAATHNGVRVYILADSMSSAVNSAQKTSLSTLSAAGAQVRTINKFPIHHDKVIIVDGQHVQLGSYAYSSESASKTSANVLVNWWNPSLAKVYAGHFANDWSLSDDFKPTD